MAMVTAIGVLPARQDQREGVTYDQAMEVFARYFERYQAAPTVAHQMGIPFKTACRVLDGHVWPAARQYWVDKVLP